MVGRRPSRMVPPICVLEISGMNTTIGCSAWLSNSAEVAPVLRFRIKLGRAIHALFKRYGGWNGPKETDARPIEISKHSKKTRGKTHRQNHKHSWPIQLQQVGNRGKSRGRESF